jgi:general secretion pathway protein D
VLSVGAILISCTGAVADELQPPQNKPAPAATPPPPPAAAPAPAPAAGDEKAAPDTAAAGDRKLRLNFRGVPLEMVLNYLSEAAGFIIVLDTEVRGKIDAWSNQPVSQEEALAILDSALSKNGYAAIRNERTLTIVSKDDAKKRLIPVKSGSDPAKIPRNEEMVTQIVPVRFINAVQLTKDLQPLLPDKATMTANESGNALVITDTQANIRRMAEIIHALDTSISSISSIRVFALKFADAKELASVIKDLFPAQTGTGGNNGGGNAVNRFRGAGGFNPFGGGGFGAGGGNGQGGGGDAAAGSNGRPNASRVVAAADERSNSLVVSAPDDVMPAIEDIVNSVDTAVDDVTELRVFHLKNADPLEMASLLSDLFPDETRSSNDTSRSPIRFGGGPFGGFGGFGAGNRGGGAAGANNSSDRMKKKGRVLAVADQRTSTVVVSAAHELMGQIAQMIDQLDTSPARKQKVFVYSLENADVQQVEQILRGMFERNTSTMNRNNQNQNSILNTRSSSQQNSSVGSGFGNSGSGGSGLGGGSGRLQ